MKWYFYPQIIFKIQKHSENPIDLNSIQGKFVDVVELWYTLTTTHYISKCSNITAHSGPVDKGWGEKKIW